MSIDFQNLKDTLHALYKSIFWAHNYENQLAYVEVMANDKVGPFIGT